MKSRKLGIGLLLMLAIVVTTGSFAYWSAGAIGNTSTAASATVTIGTGENEATIVSFSGLADDGSSALVPASVAATPGVEDTIVFTIDVSWDNDASAADGSTGVLSILSDTFVLTGLTDTQLEAMFSVTYSFTTAITAGSVTDTTVTVTLVFDTEPIDQATYDLVAAQTLELQIVFEVIAD